MNDKIFIFTEGYNCGLILNKCLESFYKYHKDVKLNIFGTSKDFKNLTHHENFNFINIDEDEVISSSYSFGHKGTASLFCKVIKEYAKDYDYVIHFDSDVIFRKQSIHLLVEKLIEGYDLVGPRRCYRMNLNNRPDLYNLQDVVQTYFFGFNISKISNYSNNILTNMIEGLYNPYPHPVLDFFDPISFDIVYNGGKIFYLDKQLVGAQDEQGNRINKYGDICIDTDFGDHLVHFGGIGSGMKFYEHGIQNANQSYASWAMKRYAMYIKLFYGKNLSNIEIDNDKYEILTKFDWSV